MKRCLTLLLIINTLLLANTGNSFKSLDSKTIPKERKVNVHELDELPEDAEIQQQKLSANTDDDKYEVTPVKETVYYNYLDKKISLKDIVLMQDFLKLKKRVVLLEKANKVLKVKLGDLDTKYSTLDKKFIQIIGKDGKRKSVAAKKFQKEIQKKNKIVFDENGAPRKIYEDENGKYYIDKDGKKVYLNDKRYIQTPDGKYKEVFKDENGEYYLDDEGNKVYIADTPYKEVYVDEDGNIYDVKYDEDGKAYIEKNGKRVYLDENRTKYIQTPDGKVREVFKDENGEYYLDDNGKKIYLNNKKFVKTPDGKYKEVFKDENGEYYLDDNGNKVYITKDKLKVTDDAEYVKTPNGELKEVLRDENGEYYLDDNGNKVYLNDIPYKEVYVDEDGNVYDVKYDKDGKAYIEKDGKRVYLDDDRKKYIQTPDGKVREVFKDAKGEYYLDDEGKRVYFDTLFLDGDIFGHKVSGKVKARIRENMPDTTIPSSFQSTIPNKHDLSNIRLGDRKFLAFYTQKKSQEEPLDDKAFFSSAKDLNYVGTYSTRLKEAREAEAKADAQALQIAQQQALSSFVPQTVTGSCTVQFSQAIDAYETSAMLICDTVELGTIRLYGKYKPSTKRYHMPFEPTSFTDSENNYYYVDSENSHVLNAITGTENIASFVNKRYFEKMSKIAAKEVSKSIATGVRETTEDLREYGVEKSSATSEFDTEKSATRVIKPDIAERMVYAFFEGVSTSVEKIEDLLQEDTNWLYYVLKDMRINITLITKEGKQK